MNAERIKWPFVRSLAGRTLYAPNERKDCTVRATALVLGIPYPAAHNLLASVGRKDRHGLDFGRYADKLGFEALPELTGGGLRAVLLRLDPAKNYLLTLTGHAMAVVRGVIVDNVLTRKNRRVRMVYGKKNI